MVIYKGEGTQKCHSKVNSAHLPHNKLNLLLQQARSTYFYASIASFVHSNNTFDAIVFSF
ncbi:hypothetical protein HMPREF3208_00218 [Gardnerella vaginalis]|uniref:Uncharacterized protein n=1 Tax=Gardnerella vaginalis TaxID=2702 RepID=A0A133P2G0_GARVA|nr:hypothetical protein HMPREF3208_00218 [Gardnerella vaginalis]